MPVPYTQVVDTGIDSPSRQILSAIAVHNQLQQARARQAEAQEQMGFRRTMLESQEREAERGRSFRERMLGLKEQKQREGESIEAKARIGADIDKARGLPPEEKSGTLSDMLLGAARGEAGGLQGLTSEIMEELKRSSLADISRGDIDPNAQEPLARLGRIFKESGTRIPESTFMPAGETNLALDRAIQERIQGTRPQDLMQKKQIATPYLKMFGQQVRGQEGIAPSPDDIMRQMQQRGY